MRSRYTQTRTDVQTGMRQGNTPRCWKTTSIRNENNFGKACEAIEKCAKFKVGVKQSIGWTKQMEISGQLITNGYYFMQWTKQSSWWGSLIRQLSRNMYRLAKLFATEWNNGRKLRSKVTSNQPIFLDGVIDKAIRYGMVRVCGAGRNRKATENAIKQMFICLAVQNGQPTPEIIMQYQLNWIIW